MSPAGDRVWVTGAPPAGRLAPAPRERVLAAGRPREQAAC